MSPKNISQFDVDDDLVALIWQLAKPKPFEQLTFSQALRRVLAESAPLQLPERVEPAQVLAHAIAPPSDEQELLADRLLAELSSMSDEEFAAKYPRHEKPRERIRAPSPRPFLWLNNVPELVSLKHLRNWVDICKHLDIDVGSDSARRRLKEWVAIHRPSWPAVPDA
jgi:hypothetical protein